MSYNFCDGCTPVLGTEWIINRFLGSAVCSAAHEIQRPHGARE